MLVQAKDKAFLIHFDHEVELLQDLTSSKEKLQKALDLLKTPSDRERANDPTICQFALQIRFAACTQLYDAVFLASNELLKSSRAKGSHHSLGRRRPRSKTYLDGAIEARSVPTPPCTRSISPNLAQ